MKPNFALSLSPDGLRLLYRAAGGWRIIGEVDHAAENLPGELAMLRKTAASLEPGGVRTKLVIPNDQIRYLTLDTGPLDDDGRRAAARAALDGATPYAVDDLAYDVSPDGGLTHVAAVARETLAEAEAFADEHRLHPVSFVAVPEDETYLGEPFFGPSSHAPSLLDPGDTVEPDGIAVVVIGAVEIPEGPVVAEPPKSEPPADEGDGDKAADTGPKDTKAEQTEKAAKPDDQTSAAANTADPKPSDPKSADAVPAPQPPRKPDPRPDPGGPEPRITLGAVRAEADDLDLADADPDADTPEGAPPEGFASKRPASAPAQAARSLGGASRDDLPTVNSATVIPEAPAETTSKPATRAAPGKPAAPDADLLANSSFLSRRDPPKPAAPAPRPRSSTPVAPVKPHGRTTATAPAEEAQRMTIFGAREQPNVGGKPRYLGLILTAILLIFLAGVAAWASIFLEDGLAGLFNERKRATATASVPQPAPEPPMPAMALDDAEAQDDAEALADSEPDTVPAALDPDLTAEDAAVLDALRTPLETPEPAEPPTEEEMLAQYAVTGIWPVAPDVPSAPALISLDDLYLTSIDPISPTLDAVALPDVATQSTDRALAVISSPVAAGTRFSLDPRGMVIPTAAGALTPDGYTVYAGRPPLVPPTTPTRFDTNPEEDAFATAAQGALAQVRPALRPEALIENNERATLDGLTRNELAAFRPSLRPKTEKAEAEKDETPTDAAIAVSRRPGARPSNFATIVENAAARAARVQNAAKAGAATESDSEPEPQVVVASVAPKKVTPSIPSSASVAREATLRGAMNLRKVNLIGVYGKPSDRRALVRLKNGRYQKVKVGDRIDGGRVSAIGDSELRYQKSGRNVVLVIPNG